jgi:hypothetical protein
MFCCCSMQSENFSQKYVNSPNQHQKWRSTHAAQSKLNHLIAEAISLQ